MNIFSTFEFDPRNRAIKCTIHTSLPDALNYVLTGYKEWMKVKDSKREKDTFRLIFRKGDQIKRVSIFKKEI